jgi:hypothetical protein
LTAIFEEYDTHPQRLRPLQAAMEERLLRAFAGLINQLRQQDLGIERYIWRSQDDAKVRDSHADYDDQVFRWDEPPAGGHPGRRTTAAAMQSRLRRDRGTTSLLLSMFPQRAASPFRTSKNTRLLAGTPLNAMSARANPS